MSRPGPCVSSVDPRQPYVQHLPCPDARYRGTWRYVARLRPRVTSTLVHPYPCISALPPALYVLRSAAGAPPHPPPAGTSHPGPPASTSEPVPIFPLPASTRPMFFFSPQSFHSILMWSYVLYHRLINPSSIRAAFWTVPQSLQLLLAHNPLTLESLFSPLVVTLSYYTQTFPLRAQTTTTPLPSSFHHARETLVVGLCTTRAPTETSHAPPTALLHRLIRLSR